MTGRGISGRNLRQFLLLAFMLSVVSGGFAQSIDVVIVEPVVGQPALGEVVVEAEAYSLAPIVFLEVYLDGKQVARFEQPPYRVTLDLGTENVAHQIEVVAHGGEGGKGAASVRTEAIPDSGQFSLSLQQLYVTASRGGERVLGLEADDFVITDQDEVQELVTFERGDIPFTAVLLIDASSSMHGQRLEAAAAGARTFVERIEDLDQVSLIAFSDRVLARTDFVQDSRVFASTLDETTARGGTAIHDHLYMALQLLEHRQGRRVAILLSDGIDSHSVLGIEPVLRKARQSQTIVYWIWLAQSNSLEFANGRMRTIFSTWHTTDQYRQQFEVLREVVEDSGGRIVPVSDIGEIEPVFVDILTELREQYVLGYYPSNERNDGRWHKVGVDVRGIGIDVRLHDGYIDR